MIVLVAVIALALLLAFRGLVVMWLWNWLMPAIVGLPEVSFLEALGLVFLVSFLFGSMFDKGALASSKKETAT